MTHKSAAGAIKVFYDYENNLGGCEQRRGREKRYTEHTKTT